MITKFLTSYGYTNMRSLLLSLCPTWKYGLGWEAVSISAIVAFISELMGITPILLVGMFVAVLVESITGVRASFKLGIDFESWRFSRCIFKVCIWVALFFMFHAFESDASMKEGWQWKMAEQIYSLFQIVTMVYFVLEYATSIAENLAVLDGKPKDAYISGIKEMFSAMILYVKERIGHGRQNS